MFNVERYLLLLVLRMFGAGQVLKIIIFAGKTNQSNNDNNDNDVSAPLLCLQSYHLILRTQNLLIGTVCHTLST